MLAFGLEQTYGRMSKAQVLGRFRCVVEPFEAPDMAALGIPVMIIEADNDPLVEAALREQLKETYPTAEVVTLSNGHFPYLSMPDEYTSYLEDFFWRAWVTLKYQGVIRITKGMHGTLGKLSPSERRVLLQGRPEQSGYAGRQEGDMKAVPSVITTLNVAHL